MTALLQGSKEERVFRVAVVLGVDDVCLVFRLGKGGCCMDGCTACGSNLTPALVKLTSASVVCDTQTCEGRFPCSGQVPFFCLL